MDKPLSLYLDVLRLAAALAVFIVHAHFLLPGGMPVLWRLAGLGGEAVTVFFVLSGFVIAHVVRARERCATDYLAARLARLYSVILPALAVTAALDCAGALFFPADYPAAFTESALDLAATLLFANELWFTSSAPASNTPFWSLGYEFWYYMIYGAARYVRRRRVRWAAVLALCAVCGPRVIVLMPVWLLGVAAYGIARKRCLRPSAAALLAVATAAGLYALATGGVKAEWHAATVAGAGPLARGLGPSAHVLYTYAFGALATLHVIAMAALLPELRTVRRATERAVRAAAAHTFAIYLFHYPIVKFLVAATATAGLGVSRAPVVAALALAAIAALGGACERCKPGLKRWFRARLRALARGAGPAGESAARPADMASRR